MFDKRSDMKNVQIWFGLDEVQAVPFARVKDIDGTRDVIVVPQNSVWYTVIACGCTCRPDKIWCIHDGSETSFGYCFSVTPIGGNSIHAEISDSSHWTALSLAADEEYKNGEPLPGSPRERRSLLKGGMSAFSSDQKVVVPETFSVPGHALQLDIRLDKNFHGLQSRSPYSYGGNGALILDGDRITTYKNENVLVKKEIVAKAGGDFPTFTLEADIGLNRLLDSHQSHNYKKSISYAVQVRLAEVQLAAGCQASHVSRYEPERLPQPNPRFAILLASLLHMADPQKSAELLWRLFQLHDMLPHYQVRESFFCYSRSPF